MKKSLLLLFISLNIFCYSQWNNGNIAFNQVRANIEFIDSNTLLVAGGHSWSTGGSNVNITQLAHLYDVTTKQSSIIAMNTPRLEPIMVRGDSGIYIIGGVSNWADVNGNGWLYENTMEVYKDGNFTQMTIPFSTADGHAVALNGKIIVAGGLKYWRWYQDAADVVGETQLWIYDEATMVWSSIPTTDNRFYSSAVTDGNIAIFAGGLSMSDNPSSILDGFSVSGAYEIYDSQTDSWTTGNLGPGSARAKISACHCNGYFVFAGGSVAHDVGSPRIDIYDGTTWTTQNMVNGTRAVEACATAGDKILFAGGLQHNLTYHHGGLNITGRVDVFDSQTQTFSYTNLSRSLMDFRMASYGRRAAASPGVSFPGWQYTAYDEIQVYEDASWINSINENYSDITLYPNPTKENITISLQNFNGNIQTEVYDLIGNRLQSTNESTISLRDYAKGIYILKVAYGDRVEEVKVIKE
jgi:hypothetical protein|tara:strand:+ start:527 stop:1930 length:1404 start_codon:yes stop_codon:yes gene_type:complete